MTVGIIGVGLIGKVLAKRLAAAEHEVAGYDLESCALDSVTMLDSATAVFEQCNVTFLSLPHNDIVRQVLKQSASALTKQHVIINTSTGDPNAIVTGEPARMIEATIGGGSQLLEQGDVQLFLGGRESDIDAVRAVLAAISSRCVHLGELGAASKFKLVHNMAIGLNRAVAAETLQFAEALGFSANKTLEVLLESPAASVAMAAKGEMMVDSKYEPPQARLSQHLKDVRLMLDAAERLGAHIPLTEQHRDLLEKAEALGFGQADNAAVIEAYRNGGATSC